MSGDELIQSFVCFGCGVGFELDVLAVMQIDPARPYSFCNDCQDLPAAQAVRMVGEEILARLER